MRTRLALAALVGSFAALTPSRADSPPAPPPGFTALFNGKDLTGWQGHVTMKERNLPPEKVAALQADRNKKMAEIWSVRDGVIYCNGSKGGVSLQTTKDYGNFELYVDWKIEKKGDSGIYLRGQPQVQIWDSDNLAPNRAADAGKGSGGLWNNPAGDKGKQPLKKADKPVGEWNTFRIVM